MKLDRRQFLISASAAITAGASLSLSPRLSLAAGSEAPRLLVVLLRGGLDGLHALQPYADPVYQRLRAGLNASGGPAQGEPHRLDGLFALHPALRFADDLYARGQLQPVVAVAPPYRERSHFDAQDCLENGTASPGGSGSGWLNRCVAAMPDAQALAIAHVMPLILRGDGAATTWSPPLPQAVDPILMQRLEVLYAEADPSLAEAFARVADGDLDLDMMTDGGKQGGRRRARLQDATAAAARFMSAADGPQVAFVEDSGWDTHGNQARILDRKLAQLDAGLQAFHDGAQAIWKRTAVVMVSEFGRTVAVNGTAGTDHGAGGVALLAGGAVRGGRIGGDWPGLGAGDLYQGRDLRATGDLRALFKGVLGAHLGLSEASLARAVFPDSATLAPMEGLIA